MRGAVVASATRNDDGSLTDNNNLTLVTDELIVEDIQDKNHSQSDGFNVSTSGYSGTGSTTVGLTSNGHEREQTTFATLGGGSVKNRDGEDRNLENTNRDLNNSQQITKDQQTAGLDATVTVDHRLATEQGRAKIQEDITKSGMIVDTVTLIATTDRVGVTDFFKETGKSHTTYEAIKSEIANNPELAVQLEREDLTPVEKETMLNQLTRSVMVELGYSTGDYQNVLVADGQDHVVKDGAIFERHGFYSEETQNAYINDALISDTEGLVTTVGHEMFHAMDDHDGSETKYSEQDNEIYATQYGNNFGDYTNVAMSVTGNGSMADKNQHMGNDSIKVRVQTESYNQLDKSKGDDFLQIAVPVLVASPEAVTAGAALATAVGFEVVEDDIKDFFGVKDQAPAILEASPAEDQQFSVLDNVDLGDGRYETPIEETNPRDSNTGGNQITDLDTGPYTTPSEESTGNGLLENIPVGTDTNANSGGYQETPITVDDLVMMAEDTEDNRISGANINHVNGAIGEIRGYQGAIDSGHIGIQGPGKVTAPGVDYITFDSSTGEVVLWDAKYRKDGGSYPSKVSDDKTRRWTNEAREVINSLPDGELKDDALEALENGDVRSEISRWPK
ncbi:hypothetical protein [Bacterioplanoides pacificum]|uniref:Uncharacterized protein n=1 Tax=Bacterioplanoides pacificum TaxID=1171596 RepID=A0ABV7VS33_9GAMM